MIPSAIDTRNRIKKDKETRLQKHIDVLKQRLEDARDFPMQHNCVDAETRKALVDLLKGQGYIVENMSDPKNESRQPQIVISLPKEVESCGPSNRTHPSEFC